MYILKDDIHRSLNASRMIARIHTVYTWNTLNVHSINAIRSSSLSLSLLLFLAHTRSLCCSCLAFISNIKSHSHSHSFSRQLTHTLHAYRHSTMSSLCVRGTHCVVLCTKPLSLHQSPNICPYKLMEKWEWTKGVQQWPHPVISSHLRYSPFITLSLSFSLTCSSVSVAEHTHIYIHTVFESMWLGLESKRTSIDTFLARSHIAS